MVSPEQDAIKSSSLLLTSHKKGCADRDMSFTRLVPPLWVGDGRSRAPNLAVHTLLGGALRQLLSELIKKHFVGSKSCVIGTAAQNILYGRANHFLSERW